MTPAQTLNTVMALLVILFFLYHFLTSSTPVTEFGTKLPGHNPNSSNLYDQYVSAAEANKVLPTTRSCVENSGLEGLATRVLLAKAHQLQKNAKGKYLISSDREAFSNLRRRLLLRGVRIRGTKPVHESHPFHSWYQFQMELNELNGISADLA